MAVKQQPCTWAEEALDKINARLKGIDSTAHPICFNFERDMNRVDYECRCTWSYDLHLLKLAAVALAARPLSAHREGRPPAAETLTRYRWTRDGFVKADGTAERDHLFLPVYLAADVDAVIAGHAPASETPTEKQP